MELNSITAPRWVARAKRCLCFIPPKDAVDIQVEEEIASLNIPKERNDKNGSIGLGPKENDDKLLNITKGSRLLHSSTSSSLQHLEDDMEARVRSNYAQLKFPS